MEVADLLDQVRQRYVDHDRACGIQVLVSPVGAILVTEGFVFDVLHNPVWCVFVPPGQVRQLLRQGLIAANNGK